MEKQQALEKVNSTYEQVNAFVCRYPHASATSATGVVSLLIDTLFFQTNLYGLAFGAAVTWGVWQWGQRDIMGTQDRVVDAMPPMGRVDRQKSEYTFKERLGRLFDPNANGPDQPRKQGIMKEEPRVPQQERYYEEDAPRNIQQQQRQPKKPLPVVDPRFSAPMDMAEILRKGFKPTRSSIFLMNTPNGYITERISKLYHIGLAGKTGGGKTGVMRMIVAQLLACESKVYMINPNFAPVKHNGNRMEDWRPIEARLKQPVARNAPEIRDLLVYFMQIFKQRREKEQTTPKRGADLFLVLGEWPVIVEEYPEAEKIIGRLLRQARQYGIHVVAEFQDALIGTIKGNSGTRANYGTAYFFGGEMITAKALLDLQEGTKIDTVGLGNKGAVYLKSFSSQAIPGRVPFFSNAALYMLLGCIGEPVTDEEVDEDSFYEEDEDEDDIDEVFAGMPDVRDEDGDEYDDEEDGDIYRAPMRIPELPGRRQLPNVKIGTDLVTKQDVMITREQWDMLVSMRANKMLGGYRQIMKLLPIKEQHAKNLNKMIRDALDENDDEGDDDSE